jgi:uroporphyrinogen-III synthase
MTDRNLNNKKVVITRPIERADALADIIKDKGGQPIIIPTLELQLVESDELHYIVDNINDFDWIIFTSPAGVTSFFKLYGEKSIPCKIAVIGVKTEEELEKHNNHPDLIPEKFTAEGLLKSFESIDLNNKKIALPRTLSARKVLPEGLEDHGADVLIAEAYTSGIPRDTSGILELSNMIINSDIDIVTFTSPLTIKNLFEVVKTEKPDEFNILVDALKNNVIVGSIGPITGKVCNEYNIDTVEPQRYTVKNMIDAIIDAVN